MSRVWDTIGMVFPSLETLSKLNPDFQKPIFVPMELTKLDLEPLPDDIPEHIKFQITQAVKAAHDESSQKVQA